MNDWTWTLSNAPVRDRIAPSFYVFFSPAGSVVALAWRDVDGWELRFRGAPVGWATVILPLRTLKKAEEILGLYLDQVRASVLKRQAVAS